MGHARCRITLCAIFFLTLAGCSTQPLPGKSGETAGYIRTSAYLRYAQARVEPDRADPTVLWVYVHDWMDLGFDAHLRRDRERLIADMLTVQCGAPRIAAEWKTDVGTGIGGRNTLYTMKTACPNGATTLVDER